MMQRRFFPFWIWRQGPFFPGKKVDMFVASVPSTFANRYFPYSDEAVPSWLNLCVRLFLGSVIAHYYTAASYVCESDSGQYTHSPYSFYRPTRRLDSSFVWPLLHKMSMTRPVLLNTGGNELVWATIWRLYWVHGWWWLAFTIRQVEFVKHFVSFTSVDGKIGQLFLIEEQIFFLWIGHPPILSSWLLGENCSRNFPAGQ